MNSEYHTGGNRIQPVAIRPEQRIRTFSDDDLKKIHRATLTVLWEAATQKIHTILEKHRPKPLGHKKEKALREIIRAAEKEIIK